MLVVCPDCVSSYRVDPASLAGRAAATCCAHCRRPLQGEPAPAAAEAPVFVRERSALPGILAGLAALTVMSGLLFCHGAIARAVPAANGLFRLAGLRTESTTPVVSDLKTAWDADTLTVEGRLVNPGPAALILPAIRITVRDDAAETLYSWTTPAPKARLGPGESVDFTSRLDKPPQQGRDLALGFVADRVALSEGGVKGMR